MDETETSPEKEEKKTLIRYTDKKRFLWIIKKKVEEIFF